MLDFSGLYLTLIDSDTCHLCLHKALLNQIKLPKQFNHSDPLLTFLRREKRSLQMIGTKKQRSADDWN